MSGGPSKASTIATGDGLCRRWICRPEPARPLFKAKKSYGKFHGPSKPPRRCAVEELQVERHTTFRCGFHPDDIRGLNEAQINAYSTSRTSPKPRGRRRSTPSTPRVHDKVKTERQECRRISRRAHPQVQSGMRSSFLGVTRSER